MDRKWRPWPRARVVKARPSAIAVYDALCELKQQRGSSVVTPTRSQLSEMTGYTPKTISAAFTTLEEAGWIDRTHVPKFEGGRQKATLLRIVVRPIRESAPGVRKTETARRRGRPAPSTQAPPATSRKGRSTVSTAPSAEDGNNTGCRKDPSAPPTEHDAVEGVQRPKGRGRSTPQDFPSERGGPHTAPPPCNSGGPVCVPPETQGWCEEDTTSQGFLAETFEQGVSEGGGDEFGPTVPGERGVPEGIQRVIDMIGCDVDHDHDEVGSDENAQVELPAGEGGA